MAIVVAGPWIGEFGWEVICWQGRVRAFALKHQARKILALGGPGRLPLFSGVPCEYLEVPVESLPGHAAAYGRIYERPEDGRTAEQATRRWLSDAVSQAAAENKSERILTLQPEYDRGRWVPTFRPYQHFVSFRRWRAHMRQSVPTIVFVRRRRALASDHNLSDQWWSELRDRLATRGIRCIDYPANVREAIEVLSRSDLAIGGSTGGLHLASLCECPHYVWGTDDLWAAGPLNCTNRFRYEIAWNPLGTPARFDTLGWRPKTSQVLPGVLKALKEMGRTTCHPESVTRWRRQVWRPGRLRLLADHVLSEALRLSGRLPIVGFVSKGIHWRINQWIPER